MIVKNEDQWVWYAIMSIIDYVYKIIIFDTGSNDLTTDIIKTFKSPKIFFDKKFINNQKNITKLRQLQLEMTTTNWFLIVDGDEVWPENSIKSLVNSINHSDEEINGIVVKSAICLGDILHLQEEKAGRYNIAGRIGQFNIRAYKKMAGYKWIGKYPLEAYVDQNNIPIQDKNNELNFLDVRYWHLRHLRRSSKVANPGFKLEVGNKVALNKIPEVFLIKSKPKIVPSPWVSFSPTEKLFARILGPIYKLRRR